VVDGLDQRCFGIGITGHDGAADGPVDHLLPKATACRNVRHSVAEPRAIFAHQGGKRADPLRQQHLNALAQPSRQHRRRATGSDGDDDVAAVDDGGNDEGRQVGTVDDVDRNARRPGAAGHLVVERPAGCGHDSHNVGQIVGPRIAIEDRDAVLGLLRHGVEGFGGGAGIPAHARSSGFEQPQLVERRLARADQHHDAGRQIEKNGKKPHRPGPDLSEEIFFL
jgi:hypothetical protein